MVMKEFRVVNNKTTLKHFIIIELLIWDCYNVNS